MFAQTLRLTIEDDSGVGHARRRVVELGRELGVAAAIADKASLVVSELGNNLVRHAGQGEILAQACGGGLALIAIDRGPGIPNVARAMQDGYSTGGTRGVGMGAIMRASDFFDVHSSPGHGTTALAIIGNDGRDSVAGVCIAKPGETVVGDGWLTMPAGRDRVVAVVDGLGHGPDAATAARVALDVVQHYGVTLGLEPLGAAMHEALRATRGAAIAIVHIDTAANSLAFMGVGNIAGAVVGDVTKQLASHNGTAGGIARKFHAFTYPFVPNDLLVLMSDGIQTRWSLAGLPGITTRHPLLIAASIFRDSARGTDDATVVVTRLGMS